MSILISLCFPLFVNIHMFPCRNSYMLIVEHCPTPCWRCYINSRTTLSFKTLDIFKFWNISGPKILEKGFWTCKMIWASLNFSLGIDLTIWSYGESPSMHSIYTWLQWEWGLFSGKFVFLNVSPIFVTIEFFSHILKSVQPELLACSVQALC